MSCCQLLLKDTKARIPLRLNKAGQLEERSMISNIYTNMCPLVAPLLPTNTHFFIIADK